MTTRFNELKELNVLYVEDDADMRALLVLQISDRFNTFRTAIDGKDGLVKFKEQVPDVLITDLAMPHLDGIGMVEQMKQMQMDDTVIIVTTAFDDDEHYSEHADLYLYKPLKIGLLVNAISVLALGKVIERKNCWDFHHCDFKPGSLIECPVVQMNCLHGINGGINAGRACWALHYDPDETTCCKEGSNCERCDFRRLVCHEEGDNVVNGETLQKKLKR